MEKSYKTSGNTILDFQEMLEEEINTILKDVQSKRTSGEKESGVNVYGQRLPILLESDEDESQFFPYAIVRISEGSTTDDDEPWLVPADIIVGIYEPDDANEGHRHIMIIIQRIIDRFAAEPLLARKYRASQDMEWALQDEDTFPFFIGGVRIKFNIPKIGRSEPLYYV